jgi:hypothetical protein
MFNYTLKRLLPVKIGGINQGNRVNAVVVDFEK